MNHQNRMLQVNRCVSAMLAGLMLTIAPGVRVFAQDAPENEPAAPQAASGPSTVFNWHDIPVNETIPIQKASFDAGGYQLVDSQGQTIVVPFENNSLYVMKFAQSANGTLTFVNDGTAPILYVPQGAGLRNLTVVGALWYPPAPVYPVYYGVAPSWDAYVAMGWYPGMHYWGGYWHSGGVYIATPGLYVEIDGTRYVGWARYDRYYHMHGGWSHVAFRNREVYHRDLNRRVDFHAPRGVGPAENRWVVHHAVPASSAGPKWVQRPQGNPVQVAGGGGRFQQGSVPVNGKNNEPSNGHVVPSGFKVPGGGTTGPGTTQKPTYHSGGVTPGPGTTPKSISNGGGGSAPHTTPPAHTSNGSSGSGGTKKH